LRAELKADIEQVQAELRETELRLQKEIEQVRVDLLIKIESTKNELVGWLVPLMLAQVAAIAALHAVVLSKRHGSNRAPSTARE
jgi:hypothetical protein